MSTLIYNINTLVHTEQSPKSRYFGKEMATIACTKNAFLHITDGKISDFGESNPELLKTIKDKDPSVILHDAENGHVFPCWVDSHTHIVFAGNRELEFENRIKGLSYEEIALRGGGILNSAKMLKDCSEDDLFQSAQRRLDEMKSLGTGAVEIKSGYGLSVESELKIKR